MTHVLTAQGPLQKIRAAAEAFDDLDPSPAEAVSWFEQAQGKFRLEVYVVDEEAGEAAAQIVANAVQGLRTNLAPLQDADWVAMALEGLPAVQAGRFVVGGAHALSHLKNGRKRLWIEASEAFGTGHHATTWGCLMALEGVLRQRRVRRVLDVGAGSGVLALAAAREGAHATAVEIDVRAAEIMVENVANNRLTSQVRVIAGDGARNAPGGHDLVFANILMLPLIRLAPILTRATAPGGNLILSGLLAKQEPLVRLAYEARGMVLRRRLRRDSWATLMFSRPAR
jgi:ribosomal protein L11 methyltransferase